MRVVDFTRGIRASLVKEGKPMAGQVGGQAVLLLRVEGGVHAIAGVCTCDGALLKDGLIVGDEIRCPRQHARFSITTGDVVAGPALNPLARWRVEEEAGRLFVREKCAARDPLIMRDVSRSKLRNVAILGAGAAGSAAAESLRRNGFKGVITLIDPDPDAPYERPLLSKDYLAGKVSAEELRLRPAGFYAQHGIRRLIDAAVAIDAVNRTVALQSGGRMAYDALLLAFGGSADKPKWPGVDLPHVHVLKTLADCERLIRTVGAGSRIVIAGASFIGMEAAAALRQRKANVSVVAPERVPFSHVLGPTIGASLMKLHERHGVQFRLGRKIVAIAETDVLLDDLTALPADIVLLGMGARLDLTLAESAGVETDAGVVVDEYLETSVPGIYAAGDIARYPDARTGQKIRVGHWAAAQRQGDTAARNILGIPTPFTAAPFFRTQHYDTSVSYVGHAADFTHIQVDGDPEAGDCSASFMSDDQLLAYVSIGRDRASLEVERELERIGSDLRMSPTRST